MPSHQARRDPLPADYQFPTHRPFQAQYDAYDVHRVDLVPVLLPPDYRPAIEVIERKLASVNNAPSADATGEP